MQLTERIAMQLDYHHMDRCARFIHRRVHLDRDILVLPKHRFRRRGHCPLRTKHLLVCGYPDRFHRAEYAILDQRRDDY